MAQDGGADEPMVINQGRAGLKQSLHHPNAGRSATNATIPAVSEAQRGGVEEQTTLKKDLANLVKEGALEEVVQIVHRYAAIEAQKATEANANTAMITTENRNTEAITRDELNRSIEATFQRFMPKTPQAVPGTT
ncbi:Uu.00g087710.m01.CDS01 [Anthostomella pinea]|uniref:Uu.00g087710.m01.CDS01 n=1 Tax=Anthostomella pinea TaxID=933095 RepID=A0AAI8VNJ7_9PEZI|nr:Uu.00g087710.m01.CDS01 [Anthostomella pinea]